MSDRCPATHIVGAGLLCGVLLWLVEGSMRRSPHAPTPPPLHLQPPAPTPSPPSPVPRPAAAPATEVYAPFTHLRTVTETQRVLAANSSAVHPTGTYLRMAPRSVPGFFVSQGAVPPKCAERRVWNGTNFWWHNEFGLEIQIVLPFAWFLHLNCYGLRTMGVADSLPFYFFADRHTENRTVRRQQLQEDYSCCPIKAIHHKKRPGGVKGSWVPPPLKQMHENRYFRYSKPLLVISNKYQNEWNRSPVNYLPSGLLFGLVDMLQASYTVVYSRPDSSVMVPDGSRLLDLQEKQGLRDRGVLLIEDLWHRAASAWRGEMPYLTFNMVQLWVYANCERFVAVQGGNAVLASYMAGPSGRVAVLVRRGHELRTREVERWYGLFSGAAVTQHKGYAELLQHVNSTFLPPPPPPRDSAL